ncbi:MAG TPA: L,D-transpeptidase family protein [Lichenihabitans sp.]|jgi:murein L,D-transpeptidase YafK|nr:L,D-transpeptidase family protein [Lichenihabitans sp.]
MPVGRGFTVLSRLTLVVFGAMLLAGCNEELSGTNGYRAYAPIPDDTMAVMSAKGTDKNAPILIRAFKKEAELEVWKRAANGRFVYIKTFPMCRWSGQLGPKVREGDRQVPEGFYTITPGSMNPNSAYYLSFNVGYPNAYDRAWGHTGGSIMVHGICSSAGCFSMTDKQIEEIYAIAREAFAGGQRAIQMESFPFRMTAENMAKYRLDPNIAFWRELKRGSDYFEATRTQPPVGVCAKHYVFGTPKDGDRFDAESACPPLEETPEIRALLSQKASHDDAEIASLVAKGVKPVRTVYQDGGQNPVFANRFVDVSRPDALAAGPTDIALDDGLKAKPVAVQLAAAKLKPPVAKGAPATTIVAASPKPADQTGTVAAAFTAAPTAYAKEEPKSATAAFFDRVISFGRSDPAPAAKPADLVGAIRPAPAEKPQAQLHHRAKPAKPEPATASNGLDPNYVALSPL